MSEESTNRCELLENRSIVFNTTRAFLKQESDQWVEKNIIVIYKSILKEII